MQRRVANVQPVKDLVIIVSRIADTRGGKRRIGRQQPLDRRAIVIKDGSKECFHFIQRCCDRQHLPPND
jgi:hypothetical protein